MIIAQTFAWFQSNSALISGWLSKNYMFVALGLGPFVSLLFAYITKEMYSLGWTLWSIRFIAFGIGYLVFIPLTWYFLGEEILTAKNIISFLLCLILITAQFFMK